MSLPVICWYKWLLLVLFVFSCVNISIAELSPADFAICGGLATAVTDALLYPIDTVKVRQQSSRVPLRLTTVLSDILKTRGLRGLFNGVQGYAGIDGIGAAIFFTSYENAKSEFSKHITSPIVPYLSASTAFVLSSSFMVPAELIKVKMQSQIFPSVRSCIKTLWKQDGRGIRGLYHGYGATLLRDLPYFALQLGCFDNIRKLLDDMKDEYKGKNILFKWALEPSKLDLLASLASGTITGVLTNPMDVVTARLMTQDATNILKPGVEAIGQSLWESRLGPTMGTTVDVAGKAIVSGTIPYKGLRDCVSRMVREEGAGAFFAGVGARVLWIAPFTALSLSLNEAFRRQLIETRKQKHSSKPL